MSYAPRYSVRSTKARDERVRLTPACLKRIWTIMGREKKIPWLFYDGFTHNLDSYLDFMLDQNVVAYGVYDRDTPLATYFLNNFMGDAAMMHFCYFDAGLSEHTAIGIDTCNFLLRNGELSALIGWTPRPFRHAWKFALAVGFIQTAIVPRGCTLNVGGWYKKVDAVVTLCTPETLKSLEA